MSADVQVTKCHRKIAENYNSAENYNRLSRVHERYRQTDERATANSERELTFTFAKKSNVGNFLSFLPTKDLSPFLYTYPTKNPLLNLIVAGIRAIIYMALALAGIC